MTVVATGLAEQIALAEDLLEARRVREALPAFDLAQEMGADADGCSAARWTAAMLLGDFQRAWRESDAIRARGEADAHRLWMGEDVRGKRVIVRCLHGFGDAIQFLRYMPRLRELVRDLTVEVPPRMLLFAPLLDGVEQVVTWGEAAPTRLPEWDVQVEVMELPYLFRTTGAELPIAERYLQVPGAEVDAAAAVMGDATNRLRVGIVWTAGEWNVSRSMPFGLLKPLLQVEGAEFWSLQGGARGDDVRAWIESGRLRDAAMCGDGLRVLASALANLDLVVTVDTLAAHMAGAMGKQVWVMLQEAADWRWMVECEDSPWYPTMRLFRRGKSEGWSGLVDRVTAELSRLIARRRAPEVSS